MTEQQYLKNLTPPEGAVDVVLDTDAYNEIDDQFAIAYLLRSGDRLKVRAICAAPFFNRRSTGPADGMEKSYDEILNVLRRAGREDLIPAVYRGSGDYLPDERTPVPSEAAEAIVKLAADYSPEKPLYIVAIGAITNVASALLRDPSIAEKVVIVWLGGHAHHYKDTAEFNMRQDVAAARVCMASAAPFVQLPCRGVVDVFTASGAELEKWLLGKNELSDYLARFTIQTAQSYAAGTPWTRVIWDVTAVAWLLGGDLMEQEIRPVRLPARDHHYEPPIGKEIAYVTRVCRDALMTDLFRKLLS